MTAEPSTQATSSKIEAFLSYAHESDKHLHFVEPLHRDLVGMIHMRSQRDVEIFRDKVDLQWGDRFRAALDNGLSGASVLFVIATTHYLDSDSCRGEFNDFLNAAKATGRAEARRLILPIVPIAAPTVFREDSEDPVAREIASIQYELIEDAVIAGEGSPEWLRAVIRLADRFIEVVNAAEAEAAEEADVLEPAAASAGNNGVDEGEDDRGYFDALGDMETDTEELTALMEQLGALMADVTAPMNDLDVGNVKSAKAMNVKLTLLAHKMKPVCDEIGETGQALREKANTMDVSVRRIVTVATSSGSPELIEPARAFLKTAQTSLSGAQQVENQMSGLLVSMAPAEAVSSVLRKTLKPMRTGIVAFNDAVRTFQKWGPELMD